MKKILIILCTVLTGIGLAAFSNKKNATEKINLVYKIDSRFEATITKEKLNQATTVQDIVPEEADWAQVAFENMTVSVLQGNNEKRELGKNGILTAAQASLLKSADYSTNFYLKGNGTRKPSWQFDVIEPDSHVRNYTYYLTVVPEKEAHYKGGNDAHIAYLKANSLASTAFIQEDQLRACRINFTVTKQGTVEQVFLESTSGFAQVDKALVELLENMPNKWEAAENAKGEKVDQQLVFFFGIYGC